MLKIVLTKSQVIFSTTPAVFLIMLTQDRLRELLHYDPDTGVFTNIKPRHRVKVGDIAGSNSGKGYLQIQIDQKRYSAHRLAWLYTYGRFPEEFIDHINGNPSDNRIVNLREVTQRENLQNRKKQVRQDISIPTGVMVGKWKGTPNAYLAHWCDISGKLRRSPHFNFIKSGSQENALQQAIAYREARITELIGQGASYTNRHGI